MGVGTWYRLERNSLAAFDQVTVDVSYLLIAIGAIMFIVSLFGCIGAIRESLCLLKVVCTRERGRGKEERERERERERVS